MYEDDFTEKARFVGEVIGQLSKALTDVEVLVKDADLYGSVIGWAIPQLKGKLNVSEAEKKAIPYVVLSNQLLALAWFAGQEKFRELYETNKKMTEWMVSVFEELRIE